MSKSLTIVCTLLTASLLLAPATARADLVVNGDEFRIDFSDVFVPGSGNWNVLTNTDDDLGDSGTLSEWTVGATRTATWEITDSFMAGTWSGDHWGTEDPDWVAREAITDSFCVGGTSDYTGEVEFGSLAGDLKYTLTLIASRDRTPRIGDYFVKGVDGTYDFSDGDVSDDFYAKEDGFTGHKQMVWTEVEPYWTGSEYTISLKLAGDGGDGYSYANALRIEVVPEPATMGLLGLGFAGMAVLRRRRRK